MTQGALHVFCKEVKRVHHVLDTNCCIYFMFTCTSVRLACVNQRAVVADAI
jgi:hypothetical protein